jgi:hypothetical protein
LGLAVKGTRNLNPGKGDRHMHSVGRLVALAVLTAAFAPAAVLGALPVVMPVVVGLSLLVAAVFREPAARNGAPPAPTDAR